LPELETTTNTVDNQVYQSTHKSQDLHAQNWNQIDPLPFLTHSNLAESLPNKLVSAFNSSFPNLIRSPESDRVPMTPALEGSLDAVVVPS
jgi:hypothetical protein